MVPKISVIIPAYNVEKYIDQCLSSLRDQTLEDIEIVVVDDGSTDYTINIIKNYCEKDSRFFLLTQKNQGSSSARNFGLSKASGHYVLFVDSDDWISKKTCEILYSKAIEEQLDVLVYDYFYVIDARCVPRNSYYNSCVFSGIDFIRKSLSNNSLTLPPCNKLIKRELATEVPFRPGYIHEDIEFTFLILLKALRVSAIEDTLYFYRRFRAGSNTSEFKVKNISNLFDIYKFIEMEFSLNDSSKSITQSADYRLIKFEKLNMESLFKLIDDSNRIDEDNNFIDFLQNNHEFRSLSTFYLKNGKSIKHKIVVKFFFINPKLYIYLGRALYPTLKILKIAA